MPSKSQTKVDLVDRNAVLKILTELLDQANQVEADTGETPSAFEALDWAMSEVKALPKAIHR